MWTVLVCLLLAAGALASNTTAPYCVGATHSLLLGNRTYGDRLLYSGDVRLDSSFFRVQSKDFRYPLEGSQARERITRVEAIDSQKDGSGGCAYLTGGGVGQTYVQLHLKTKRGKGLEFHINIFGHS